MSRLLGGRWVGIVATTLLIGALTALVFLIRSGDPSVANWPVTWELRSSDNGVLFQVMQDLFSGRTLDWSFSPQVYVFPELPISFLSYVLAGGNIYVYYLVVAVVNNCLLFLVIYGVLRVLTPDESPRQWLARAALASLPLLLFPLIGTSWLVSYHLAASYYFGMYLMLLGAPALVLSRSLTARVIIAVGLALTAASNPLALVFAFPAFAATMLVLGIRRGWRATLRPLSWVGAVLGLALVVRLLIFAPLQGTSPLTYVDADVFAGRLAALEPYFSYLAYDLSTRVILTVGALLAIVCLVGAAIAAARYLRRSNARDDRLLAVIYFGLVPLAGLAGTFILMITHYLYFWPVLILPFVLVLMAVPKGWAERALPIGAVALVATALVTGAVPNLATTNQYFGYRSAETQCLDEALPAGAIGYSTFSDARRLSLTSTTGFRLIQIKPDGMPTLWLTNREYVREPGSFFYLNGHGDELAIDRNFLSSTFGEPDREVACSDTQSVVIYTDPAKLAAIADFYVPRR